VSTLPLDEFGADGSLPSDDPRRAPIAVDIAIAIVVDETVSETSAGPTCTSSRGWSLSNPQGWYESDCRLFSPSPITEPDPTMSDAPVQVVVLDGTWEALIAGARPDDRVVTEENDLTAGDARVLAVSSVQTEPGWFDTGTALYEIWVDGGSRVLVLTAWSADGNVAEETFVVNSMWATLVF